MNGTTNGGVTLRQTTMQAGQSGPVSTQPATYPPRGLWRAAQAAEFFGVSERKFHQMRTDGLAPAAIELSPRALRWVPSECEAMALSMPRRTTVSEPHQFLRSRIERLKSGASATTAAGA